MCLETTSRYSKIPERLVPGVDPWSAEPVRPGHRRSNQKGLSGIILKAFPAAAET